MQRNYRNKPLKLIFMNKILTKSQDIRSHSRQLVRELHILKGVFQNTGFTYSQCHTLFELKKNKALNLMELSQKLLLDKSNVSRLLKGLIKKGLVEAQISTTDKRQKLFRLTTTGLKSVENNNALANEQVENALTLLSLTEQQAVLDGLKLYAKALGQSRQQADFQFRPIEKKDNEQVARLIQTVMTEYGAVGEGYSIQDPEVHQMYEAYQDEKAYFLVIEKKHLSGAGKIVGCGGIGPLTGGNDNICELKKMYFYPEARGKGLGKTMVRTCLEKAQSLDYQICYLETVERMWQANLLYKKMGFESLTTPMGCTGHSGCDAWYAKSLKT